VDSEPFDDEPPSSRRRTESYSFPNAVGAASQHQYPPAPYNQYSPGHAQLPQQHGTAQYAQQSGHVQGPTPPILSRPSVGHEVHRQDHGYERGWPRPGPGGQSR
jgi:hypothetical protein